MFFHGCSNHLPVRPVLTPDDLKAADDDAICRMAIRLAFHHYRYVSWPEKARPAWLQWEGCFAWTDLDPQGPQVGVLLENCICRLQIADVPLVVVQLYRRGISIERAPGFDDFIDEYEQVYLGANRQDSGKNR